MHEPLGAPLGYAGVTVKRALPLLLAISLPLAVIPLYRREGEDWLREAAGSSSFRVATAARALSRAEDARIAQALPLLFSAKRRQEDPKVRHVASSALRALRPRLAELLLGGEERGGAWQSLREYVLRISGESSDEFRDFMHLTLQTRDEDERAALRDAVAALGPAAKGALARLSSRGNPKVRAALGAGSPAEALDDEGG